MSRLRTLLIALRSSLWFLPTLIVVASGVLAAGLIEIDSRVNRELLTNFPRLFGAGAEGSRGMLSSIAGSMITVAGVTFSITIVALSQASSQYSSRILRNFMRDRANQAVLGVFLGIFTYCLIVLRAIRGGDEGVFIPSLAVFTAIILALLAIGFLIFFIHHVASSIQASNVIASAASDTFSTIDRLFQDRLLDEEDETETRVELDGKLAKQSRTVIPAPRSGYIQSHDHEALLSLACKHQVVMRVHWAVGEFVVHDAPLVTVYSNSAFDEQLIGATQATFGISRLRTIEQDPGFGVRQIVDIALRALSPGVNDTTTGLTCIDYLTAINVRIANRRIATPLVYEEGVLRVIPRGPTFATFIADSFDEIRNSADGNASVILRLLLALKTVAITTDSPARKRLVFKHISLVEDLAKETIRSEYDAVRVKETFNEFTAGYE